jgi:hypothetical protein
LESDSKHESTGLSRSSFTGKFYGWRERYGKVNEHNGWVPRDFWLEEWEKRAIIAFHLKNPLEGYRRLTFMMLDADIVAVSPATVWRVLSRPPQPHQHWHIDVSYLNVCATFYYLCSVLDGYSTRMAALSSPKPATTRRWRGWASKSWNSKSPCKRSRIRERPRMRP